jgi:hypothetical protein
VDLLAPFGGVYRAWAHPVRESAVPTLSSRLNDWASAWSLTPAEMNSGRRYRRTLPARRGLPDPGNLVAAAAGFRGRRRIRHRPLRMHLGPAPARRSPAP